MTKPFLFEFNPVFDTLEVFRKISAVEKYSFFLDSVEKGKNAEHSIIGFKPDIIIKSKQDKTVIIKDEKTKKLIGNPIKHLKTIFQKHQNIRTREQMNAIPFPVGAIGYLSYDMRHYFEKLPATTTDDMNLPDMYFAFCKNFLITDSGTQRTRILILSETEKEARGELKIIYEKIGTPIFYKKRKERIKIKSNLTKNQFKKMVIKAKKYIRDGDIFQANLSQRLECEFFSDPFLLYKNLRIINPSPFSCFLSFPELKIFGCSPERLLKIENGKTITRPIAGTYPRGLTNKYDRKLCTELLLDAKERAEHIMLVDLERNDLGRVCKYGSVKVNEMMVTEKYSHVFHIVSNVVGILKKDKEMFEVIASVFPGGTITGCPKIRCMEIIDELEPTVRGPYTGSCGWLGYNGNCDLNILIRTFVLTGKKLYFQVGAGIVADSVPEREYYETLHKAGALIKALKKTCGEIKYDGIY
ncbi:MAG: anthranilate synthase component I family protein [Elusimicrobiota bacterium]